MNRIQNTIFSLLSHDVYSPVAINHHFAKELNRQIATASKSDIELGLTTISESLEKASSPPGKTPRLGYKSNEQERVPA
jgi:hypothetical protein